MDKIYLVRAIRDDGKKCWCTFTKISIEYHDPKMTEASVLNLLSKRYGFTRFCQKIPGTHHYMQIPNIQADPESHIAKKGRKK